MEIPNWMNLAQEELGIRRYPKGSTNPRITQYHENTNIQGYDDKVAWCSSFLNWVFTKSGHTGTGSALARSWLDWGKPISEPKIGCVVILERENPTGWQGHVGLFLSIKGDHIYLLGGNQLDEVREHHYPISSILGYRWPT